MPAVLPSTFNTPQLVIDLAMFQVGLVEKGQKPSGEDYALYLPQLNMLIGLWQTQGIKLFLWLDTPVPLTAGQPTYNVTTAFTNFSTNPLQAREVYYLMPDGVTNYPLIPFSWNEWITLSTRSQPGLPTNYFLDKQATSFIMHPWPVPDAAGALGSIHVVVRQRAPQMVQLNEQTIFPTEWFGALVWGLADEISIGQPAGIVQHCAMRALMYKEALEAFDVEDNTQTTLQVDQRMGYARSRFR